MNSLINAAFQCLGYRQVKTYHTSCDATLTSNEQTIVQDVLTTILSAEKAGKELEKLLNEKLGTTGWTQKIAQAILGGLVNALEKSAPLGQAVKEACEKSSNEALEFAHEHPVFLTVVALGILVLLTPWVLEALGFAEIGIVEGELWDIC